MTANDASQLAPAGLTFLSEISPLPLIDPTEAARLLGLKRHTLACYRSLGGGPAYYKFGRWIRYTPVDLAAWSSRSTVIPLTASQRKGPLVDTRIAAAFLTVTRCCLTNYRRAGGGPPYRRFGRRFHYAVDDLKSWAAAQRCDSPRASTPIVGEGMPR